MPTAVLRTSHSHRPDQGGGQTAGDRTATFELQKDLAVYGGFAGGEISRDQRDSAANLTLLSGDLFADDVPVICETGSECVSLGSLCVDGACIILGNNTENSFHVVTGGGGDSTAVLDGFTVTAGNANAVFPDDSGGGMVNEQASPTVAGCTFKGNAAIFGGGISVLDADPLFADANGADDTPGNEDDDFRLTPESPAIDSGSNGAVPPDVTTDLDGNPRFTGCEIDMGANEYQGPTGDFDDNCVVDLADHEIIEICLEVSGPVEPPPFQECLNVFDFDADLDVDLLDFAVFQRLFDGP